MKRLILALQFLTVFRVRKDVRFTPADLSSSMAFFPLIGALQGAIVAGADWLLRAYLPPGVLSALVLIILILTNGGLHLDGFADTVDGLAGGRTPEERLSIMRDSRIGAVGVAFVALLILLKYSSLNAFAGGARTNALFLFPLVGRWAMVPMACLAPYARREGGGGGGGEAFVKTPYTNLLIASAISAGALIYVYGAYSIILLAMLGALAFIVTAFFKRKLGGVTGDVFGFQSEVSEAAFLILLLAFKKMSSIYI